MSTTGRGTSSGWTWSKEHQRYYRYSDADRNGNRNCIWAPTGESSQHASSSSSQAQTDGHTSGGASESVRARVDSGLDEMTPPAPNDVALDFTGTPERGWEEFLDRRYRVRARHEEINFFKQGRVFAMLWVEPAGESIQPGTASENSRITTQRYLNPAVTKGRFGEEVFSQIRRFVVVKVNRSQHFVLACAITTYGDRGVTKPGCNPAEHTIVYLRGQRPQYIRGEFERGMVKAPIAIVPSSQYEEMKPQSRLRFGKVFSIECNVKVRDIGMVAPEDRSRLAEYYQDEMNIGFEPDDEGIETHVPIDPSHSLANDGHGEAATSNSGGHQPSVQGRLDPKPLNRRLDGAFYYSQDRYLIPVPSVVGIKDIGSSGPSPIEALEASQYDLPHLRLAYHDSLSQDRSHQHLFKPVGPDHSTHRFRDPMHQDGTVPMEGLQYEAGEPAVKVDEDSSQGYDDFALSTLQGSNNIGFSSSQTLLEEAASGFSRNFNTTGYLKDMDVLDISSHETTPNEREAKDHIAHFLAVETELNSLSNAILSTMDESSFTAIMQQALQVFYKGLQTVAVTNLEKRSLGLLKSQRGRARISHMIAYSVNAHRKLENEDRLKAEEQNRLRAERIERFAAELLHTTSNSEEFADTAQDCSASEASTSVKGDEQSDDENDGLPNINEMKRFLGDSEQFQVLLNSLRWLLLSQELKDVVQATPVHEIWLSNEDERSFTNQFKSLVEDRTMLVWNWWPLQPRMRPLKVNESRVIWYCSCGAKLWKEITIGEAELLRHLLSKPAVYASTPSEGITRQRRTSMWTRLANRVAHNLGMRTGAQPGTPTTVSNTESTGSMSTASTCNSIASLKTQVPVTGIAQSMNSGPGPQTQQATPSSSHLKTSSSIPGSSGLQRWILFGVQGSRRSIELEQIAIDDHVQDGRLYRSLRKHYRKYRGTMKLWLSIWRLSFCDGVKFDRMAPDLMLGNHTELPNDFVEYEYQPKPPDARNPLIDRHEADHFLSCDSPCRWNIFHECVPELINRKTIERIPRKLKKFDVQNVQSPESEAWGLKARHEVSAAYVAFYHILILIPPFIFWGWWQSRHPNDLQNASIPATVAIGLLSLFWGTNGILTEGRLMAERGS